MANTFVKIASVTVGAGGASSMTFTSIPATYTDLVLKYSARSNSSGTGADNMTITFNDNTSSYTQTLLYVLNSTTAESAGGSGRNFQYVNGGSTTASTFCNGEFYIPNYAASNNKSFSVDIGVENNSTNANLFLNAGLWSNSAAITKIALEVVSWSFAQYSTATLYGIKKN
jgi:hypothetical protein